MMIKLPRSLVLVAILVTLNVFTPVASFEGFAAVVEFYPDQVSFPSVRIQNNLNGLQKAMETITHDIWADIHIVVFPEYAILGEAFYTRETIAPYLENIPYVNKSNYAKPCHDPTFKDRPILTNLSCLAEKYDVMVVANMGDIQPCDVQPCPSDGKFHYNTNVVLESDGTLIAKYHKVNLRPSETKLFNPGTNPNTTCVNLGATYGILTCHDLLFREPAHCLLSKRILGTFLVTGSCGNQFPFYISTAIQQGWARKNQVNLVVANQHFPSMYRTGSGVYNYRWGEAEYAKYYMISGEEWTMGTGKIIYSSDGHQSADISDVGNVKVQASTHLNYTLLQNKQGTVEIEYKDNTSLNLSLRCNLEYSIQSSPPNKEQYALVAYIGPSKSDDNFYYAVCTLVKCPLSGQCGEPVEGFIANTIFGKVVLNGTFAEGSDFYVTALGNELELIDEDYIDYIDLEKKEVTIKDTGQPLLAVSLWTRVDVG